jgi:hypothetical protein
LRRCLRVAENLQDAIKIVLASYILPAEANFEISQGVISWERVSRYHTCWNWRKKSERLRRCDANCQRLRSTRLSQSRLNSEEKKPKSQEKEPKSHVLIYRVLRGEKNVPPVIPQISLPHIDGSIGCVSHLVNDILDRCSRSSLNPRHLEADMILEHSNACKERHRGGDSRPQFQLGIVSLVCLDGARDHVRVCRPG